MTLTEIFSTSIENGLGFELFMIINGIIIQLKRYDIKCDLLYYIC